MPTDVTKQDPDYVRKMFIEDTVRQYVKAKKDYQQHQKQVKIMRGSRKNVYASDDKKDLRWGLSFPKELFFTLDRYLDNPRFLNEDKEYEWFMKRFPDFKIPDKF